MKTALVTGGNRGIGKAIAAGLRDAGLRVIIGARDPDEGAAAASELGVESKRLDLNDPVSVKESFAWIGEVAVLVNNAGILEEIDFLDANENFARSMQIMVHAPFELIRAARPGMKARKYGRIVNLSSGWGSFDEGFGGGGAYSIAKASLNALTLRASQVLPDYIKINSVCPGWVATRMGGRSAPLSAEEGAETAIWAATLPDDGPTGRFFRDKTEIAW